MQEVTNFYTKKEPKKRGNRRDNESSRETNKNKSEEKSEFETVCKAHLSGDIVASFESYSCVVGAVDDFDSPLFGMKRAIEVETPLSTVIDNANADATRLKELLDADPALMTNCFQRVTAVSAVQKEQKIVCGTKFEYPALYYAVLKGNVEAVRVLLKLNADHNAKVACYRLEGTTHSVQDLRAFTGADQIEQPAEANGTAEQKGFDGEGEDELASAGNEKKQPILDAAKLSIPAWDPAECQWGALGTACLPEPSANKADLTAFQLAFALQNLSVFEAFLEHEAVQRMAGHLILTTMLPSWPASGGVWPTSIANMQSIVELTVVDPQNAGPVPAGIFKLTNLVALDVHGSGYTSIPDEIGQLVNLEIVDLSGMKLAKIPVSQMANCQKLTDVRCENIKVASPPPEIVSQGSAAVAQYIIGLGEGAEENNDVLLMFIGDGEAGKTSTLLALKNTETNTARAIGVDDRTIGIDISEFKPYPDVPLRFSAWDFGGQAVYAIMQQLFMSRRALYPLLWRVRESVDVSRFDTMMKCDVCRTSLLAQKGEKQQPIYRVKGQGLCHAGCASYESLIASWTERLQFRVPGVTVVLIATHIDCATTEQVDDQCDIVAKIAQRILARQDALGGDVDRLKIHNNGQSLRVNNVSGEGVKELRDQLRAVAEGLSFYGEVIPSSYARLRRKLREMQRRSDPGSWRTWMVWTEYVAMAKECGIVDKEALDVATQFFHETGELRYYGKIAKVHRVGEGTKIEANYRSKGKWYPAKIKRARDDGTYDIDYDDGEMETRVKIECIRSRDGKPLRASTSRSSNRIEEGDKVEANYRGRGRYFPAKVRRDRGDGTYDLDYDDGETELRASEDMIRLLSKGASRATPVAAPAVSTGAPKKASEPAQIPLVVGMKVQRAYRGKGALCPGRVTAVSANGTATVAYDGGFVETNVPRDGLTLTLDEHSLAPEAATSTPASSAAVAIAPGLRVTYYSKGKWEDGEIITISPTGEFEVGGAGRSSVRVGRAQWRFIGEDLFLVKARVMVDYLRLGVMYPGTIAAVNEDGTYDIDYDSGEKEYSAPKEALQTLDEEIEEIKGKFREGMKVECRYKEKERYFPGVISRCRLNGTYDIEYDDGEREMGVDPALIRVPPAAKKAAAATKKTSVLQNRKDRMNMLLSSTLFPNPFWIVDVLRGLIRHDHSAVLHLIDQDARMPLKTKNLMRRRVHRLMQRGLLHSTLLPYIWSGIAGTSEDAEKNSDEFRRLIALLGAFDILMERPGEAAGSEWVVPSLSAGKHARTMDGNAFVDEGLPFSCRIVYDSLPPYFDMMLIAHIMNNGAAQTVDFIEGAAAFRKFGNKALLFAGMGKVGDPKCVFRSEQLEDTQFKKVLREDQCHVVITSSSRRLMKALEAEVTVLEGFFPGLRRLATLFPCYSCRCARVQAQQISAAAPLARSFKSIRNLPVSSGSGDAALDQYLAAEQREVARLEDLKSVEDNPSVRDMNLDRATVAKAFPAVAQAYFDFPDFKLLVSYSELNKITGRMRIYCPDKSTQTARYQKEVIYLCSRIQATSAVKVETADAFTAEIDATSEKISEWRKAFSAEHQLKDGGDENWRDVVELCSFSEQTLQLAFGLCPRLQLFGSLDWLQASSISALQEGAVIEANYRGRGRWFAGKIMSVNSDGSYDIDYDDGERERAAPANMVRSARDVLENPRVGEQVEFFDGRAYSRGVVVSSSGRTYTITLLKDGEECDRVDSTSIRKAREAGDKIECNVQGLGVWWPGRIAALGDKGTYVVLLDRGGEETISNCDLIRSPKSKEKERPGNKLGGLGSYAGLIRGDIVAPFLHVLNTAAALLASQVAACPAISVTEDVLDGYDEQEYKKFCEDNAQQLRVLQGEYPELKLADKSHFLAQCYGFKTPACNAEHFRLIKAAVESVAQEPDTLEEVETLSKNASDLTGPHEAAAKALLSSGVDINNTFSDVSSHLRNQADPAFASAGSTIMDYLKKQLAAYKTALECRSNVYLRKARTIASKVRDTITAAKTKIEVVALPRRRFYESLQNSDIGATLDKLAIELETMANLGAKLLDLKASLARNRLGEVYQELKVRLDDYQSLLKLRAVHAPVWYFGGESDQNYGRRRNLAARDFLDATDELICLCPAEVDPTVTEDAKEVTALPVEPCSVFISHSGDFKFIPEYIIKAVTQEGIDVECLYSSLRGVSDRVAEHITSAKVFICCIDANYATTPQRIEEYRLAVRLRKEIIPVLLSDYQIHSYQKWWPDSMGFLERHSLFVDLRSATDDGESADETISLCATALVPTMRKVLNEWTTPTTQAKPAMMRQKTEKKSSTVPAHEESEQHTHDTAAEEDEADDGAQLIVCERCALEGNHQGRFDRWACKGVLERWTAEELERRGRNENAEAVALCPVKVCCNGAEKHEMLLTDLLACRVQETTIPCPRCRSNGVLPPYCFQREVCLAELEYNRGGSMLCKRCHQEVPLFELLKSEVFISYNWGRPVCPDTNCASSYWEARELTGQGLCTKCERVHTVNAFTVKNSTQMLVNELKVVIEEEAGVTCWQDLDRLVGGKNLVKEMEAGVQYAEVVVIFLNDAYTRSVNCMKEYLFATKHGKYVIPVLLPGYRGLARGPDGAYSVPEKWWPEDMSSLQQFPPVLLMKAEQQEAAVFEICERIQSRFHRAQRFATADDAIAYLRDYSSWQTMRKAFFGEESGATGGTQSEEKLALEARLEAIFQGIDVDANGFVDADEMALYLDKSDALLSSEQIASLFSEADVDCDGQLSLEEFKLAILSTVSHHASASGEDKADTTREGASTK